MEINCKKENDINTLDSESIGIIIVEFAAELRLSITLSENEKKLAMNLTSC